MCGLYLTLAEFQALLNRQYISTWGGKKRKQKNQNKINTQKKLCPGLHCSKEHLIRVYMHKRYLICFS